MYSEWTLSTNQTSMMHYLWVFYHEDYLLTPMHVEIYVATTWFAIASLNGWWSGCTIPTPRWMRSTAVVRPATRGRGSTTCCLTLLTASHQVWRFSHGVILSIEVHVLHWTGVTLFFRVCLLSVPEVWVNLSGGLHLWYGPVCCVCPAIRWDVQLPGMGSCWDDL